jgi:hypothetical protein
LYRIHLIGGDNGRQYSGVAFHLNHSGPEYRRNAQMVLSCANPSCAAQLIRPQEGRLFQFEIRSISIACEDNDTSVPEVPSRQTARFWLCGKCAGQFAVALPADAAVVVPVTMQSIVGNSLRGTNPYEVSTAAASAELVERQRFRSDKLSDLPLS